MDYGAPAYYDDDGLGGLGGDDGLGGNNPPPQSYAPYDDDPYGIGYGDDGLMLEPVNQQQQQQQDGQEQEKQEQDGDAGADEDNQELADFLDDALADQPAQTTSQLDSSQRNRTASGYYDDDDEATEDEIDMAETAEEVQQEATPEPSDPAAQETQRQNALLKECYDAMTEVQRNRLEAYTRSGLQKKTMKKVLQELTGTQLNDRIVLAISSITKMFVGELVETARLVAATEGHSGALLPRHIRQAYNALSADGRVPHRTCAKPLRLC